MIDKEGFRANVGIIVTNGQGKVLWAKRMGNQSAWQFPQGGILENETVMDAMYRELHEELGLRAHHVTVLAESKQWLRYHLPQRFQRIDNNVRCVGQKQKWFLLQLISNEACVKLDVSNHPEFERWRWVDYWYPIKHVIYFKRYVYRQALEEFAEIVIGNR